jgi:hypothetical protein
MIVGILASIYSFYMSIIMLGGSLYLMSANRTFLELRFSASEVKLLTILTNIEPI